MQYDIYTTLKGEKRYVTTRDAETPQEAIQKTRDALNLPEHTFPLTATRDTETPLERRINNTAGVTVLALFWISGVLGHAQNQPGIPENFWHSITPAVIIAIAGSFRLRHLIRLSKERPNEKP